MFDAATFEHDVMYFLTDNWLWICIGFIAIQAILGFKAGMDEEKQH